ncbi:hypothetical protein C8R45DRAFT_1040276 [Mycena sanguinolenta]|nr:hypothetical protein C8R45DRAFT_1040276 [Mycena sanguinolenta]
MRWPHSFLLFQLTCLTTAAECYRFSSLEPLMLSRRKMLMTAFRGVSANAHRAPRAAHVFNVQTRPDSTHNELR